MSEVRIGRQTPTQFVAMPYYKTKGADAIKLYSKTGRTAQEWQELLMFDILAVNEDGLWIHSNFGYPVPRRNGKNEVVAIRELNYFAFWLINCRVQIELAAFGWTYF